MLKAIRLFLFFLFTSGFAFSQQYSIYQNITTSNGLPSNYVFGVCEDANGFLWIGTDKGLCRFDGFRWRVWDRDNGLVGNYISKVSSDEKDGIWIEISEKGYYHFTAAKGATRLTFPDKKGVMGISYQAGNQMYTSNYDTINKTENIYMFSPTRLAQPELIYSYKKTPDIVVTSDWKNKKVYALITNNTSRKHDFIKSKWPVQFIQLQKRDTPVIYLSNNFILTSTEYISFSPQGKVLKRSTLKIGQPLREMRFTSDSVLISNAHVYKYGSDGKIIFEHRLFADQNTYANNLVSKNGIYVYDIKTGYYFIKHTGEKNFYNHTNGLGTNYVNHIYEANNGTSIISTLGAGLQIIKNNYRKTYFTDNKLVRTVLQVDYGWYLLAGDKVYQANSAEKSFREIGNTGSSTLTMHKSGDLLLIGSLKGISLFKNGRSITTPFRFYDLTAGISSIINYNGGFLAGTYGNGLVSFDNKQINRFYGSPEMRIIEKIYPTDNGYALLSYEDGMIISDTTTKTKIHLTNKNGLLSSSVYSLYTANDTFWIGTKGGLNVFAQNRVLKIIPFTAEYKNEKVICAFKDQSNKLWAVSNQYLFTVSGNVLKPVASHPLVGEGDVITTANYNNVTGELAIGSNKAFSIINTKAIQPDIGIRPTSLLHVRVDGTIQTNETLRVPYKFGKIEFEITPSSTSSFARTRYYYKLSGRDDVWNEVKDSLNITFSALRPGKYQLITKTKNADGFESKEMLLAAFIVDKPFWQQWPFMLLCILATIALTALIVKEVDKARRRKKEMHDAMQNSLQNERERISKDLHDHLGANLATIIAQTDNIEARLYKGDIDSASKTVQHLSAQTRETMNVLRETIWAVQESEHTLDEFIIRIRTFLQRVLESTLTTWEVRNGVQQKIVLTPTQTLHLFRVIQEATQNIIKHSQATVVVYEFSASNKQLHVSITDNGKGFQSSSVNTNGLFNIKERVKTLQGSVIINGTNGTSIILSFPV